MLSDTTIGDVGETLVSLLSNEMEDIKDGEVALLSPAEASEKDIRVSLFLYSIVENPSLRNDPPSRLTSNNSKNPPISLDLHYMLTCYAAESIPDFTQRTLQANYFLGQAIRIFYDHKTIKGTLLKGSLAGTEEELHITLNTITLEDITRIWSVFPDTPYRTSVCYIVTPVKLESKRVFGDQRVVSKQIDQDYLVHNREQ